MSFVEIAGKQVGDGQKTFIVAELGINHNGDLNIARKLIDAAKDCGCDAVKFQKRTVDTVYSVEELARPRENPFGSTNGDLKRGLEFSESDYQKIDAYCREKDILWTASPWDEESVYFLERFHVPYYKIASACLTDEALLRAVRATGKPVMLSTGMSTQEEIDICFSRLDLGRLILLSCTSLYPPRYDQIHLRRLATLREKYHVPVGYSGHETDDFLSAVAVGMGACVIERHFTLDRGMWGSDHKASIEPDEMKRLVERIRNVEQALGDAAFYRLPEEEAVRSKLRRF